MATFTLADLMRSREQGAPAPQQGTLENFRPQPVMFLGENSQTADRQALARAQQMAANGEDANAIRQATGWFQHEGRWSYEVDDRAFRQTRPLPNTSRDVRFFDYFSHPEVRRAYPNLSPPVNTSPLRQPDTGARQGEVVFGAFDPDDNRMWLRERRFDNPNPSDDERSILTPLHELQHAIDGHEQFPRNGDSYEDDSWERRAYSTQDRFRLSPAQRRAREPSFLRDRRDVPPVD